RATRRRSRHLHGRRPHPRAGAAAQVLQRARASEDTRLPRPDPQLAQPRAGDRLMPAILVSLSSFGAAEVRRHGQLWFTRLAQRAGADGVEVRGELLLDAERELPALAAAAREAGMQRVFSSPEGPWSDDGRLDAAALDRALASA